MIRKSLLALGAVAFCGVAVLGYAASRGVAIPGRPLPTLPASLDAQVQAGDSVGVAGFAQTRCRLLFGQKRRGCYEDLLLQLVSQDKIKVALGALNLLGQRESEIRKFGHDYSHVIGINAWSPGKDVGEVYLQCSELFQSGCYHGVVQAYFAYTGTDSASVAGLCNKYPAIAQNEWLRFQCVHGIGHGLVQAYTMNLPHALDGCDKLGVAWDSESCYGGAFMEFIVGGRGQSHHVHMMAKKDSTTAGEMDHSKMDMGHEAAAPDTFPPFAARDVGDPLYPCSVLKEKYHRACYEMQAGLVVERTGLDFVKVAAVCETAPEPMRKVCYQGMGTYVSGVTNRDPSEATRLCSQGSTHYRPWCFVGVVKNFVDVTANPRDGLDYCKMLIGEDIVTSCYVAVGEEAAVLYPAMERRDTLCMQADTKYAPACRYGAGLNRERPPALPVN